MVLQAAGRARQVVVMGLWVWLRLGLRWGSRKAGGMHSGWPSVAIRISHSEWCINLW